jgi:hypothetical protein
VTETIENYGLTSEVLYVSKLDCAKIIPTAKKKFLRETKWSDSPLTAGSNPQRGMGVCGEGAELLALLHVIRFMGYSARSATIGST